MATQAVSSLSLYQEIQSFYQNRQNDLQALGNALQSGDLNSAQQVYNQLVSLGQNGPFQNTEPFARADRAQDFEAIGTALSAGDLGDAQAAFAQLQQSFARPTETAAQNSPAYSVNLTGAQTGTAATDAAADANATPAAATSSTSTASSQGSSSPESIYQQVQAFRSQRESDLQQLGSALEADNLSAAQQDYNNLVQLGQTGPFANGQPFRQADRVQDFQALGQDLQAGNLESAQQDFASLESTLGRQSNQTASGANTNASAGTIPEIVINVGGSGSSPQPSTNGPELVLNVPAPSSGSPEEIEINYGNDELANRLTVQVSQIQNSGEEVKICLPQASNNENIVLNLFGSASSSSSASQGSSLNVQG